MPKGKSSQSLQIRNSTVSNGVFPKNGNRVPALPWHGEFAII
jgi:hypothetical protein